MILASCSSVASARRAASRALCGLAPVPAVSSALSCPRCRADARALPRLAAPPCAGSPRLSPPLAKAQQQRTGRRPASYAAVLMSPSVPEPTHRHRPLVCPSGPSSLPPSTPANPTIPRPISPASLRPVLGALDALARAVHRVASLEPPCVAPRLRPRRRGRRRRRATAARGRSAADVHAAADATTELPDLVSLSSASPLEVASVANSLATPHASLASPPSPSLSPSPSFPHAAHVAHAAPLSSSPSSPPTPGLWGRVVGAFSRGPEELRGPRASPAQLVQLLQMVTDCSKDIRREISAASLALSAASHALSPPVPSCTAGLSGA